MNEEAIKKMIAVYAKDILGDTPNPHADEMLLTLCLSIERTTRDEVGVVLNEAVNKIRNLNRQ